MKKIKSILLMLAFAILSSCKPSLYAGSYGQVNQTQVILSESNFKTLGSFTGTAIAKKKSISINNKDGLISLAKKNLLINASNNGIKLTGSRTLVNIVTDIIENSRKIKIVVSGEIIEFVK